MGVTGLNKADRATERGPVVVVVVAAIASLVLWAVSCGDPTDPTAVPVTESMASGEARAVQGDVPSAPETKPIPLTHQMIDIELLTKTVDQSGDQRRMPWSGFPVPLTELAQRFGAVYVPSYLPEGYSLESAEIWKGYPRLRYRRNDGGTVMITQHEGEIVPPRRSSAQPIVIGGAPGYLVWQGGGVVVLNPPDQTGSRTTWYPDAMAFVRFQKGDHWFELWSLRKPHALATFVAIAESMVPRLPGES